MQQDKLDKIWWQGTLDYLLHREQSQAKLLLRLLTLAESRGSEKTSLCPKPALRGEYRCGWIHSYSVNGLCLKDYMHMINPL